MQIYLEDVSLEVIAPTAMYKFVFPSILAIYCAATISKVLATEAQPDPAERKFTLSAGASYQSVEELTKRLGQKDLSKEDVAGILINRGVMLWQVGKPVLALKDFNEATKLFPENPAIYNNRGNVLLDLDLPTDAIKDYDRAILLEPAYAAAFNNRGNAFLRLGHAERAKRDFGTAIRLRPLFASPYNGLGQLLGDKRPYAAVRYFAQAIRLNPNIRSAFSNRASVYRKLQRYDAAIKDLNIAIFLSPNDAEARIARAEAYIRTNRLSDAIADLSKAIELQPNSEVSYALRALAYADQRVFDQALADLDRAIQLNPRYTAAYKNRATIYLSMGEPSPAIPDIERAIKITPRDPSAFLVRARAYEALDLPEKAISDYHTANRLDPHSTQSRQALGRLGYEVRSNPKRPTTLGTEEWHIYIDGDGRYFAESDTYSMTVPLEMVNSADKPRLLNWEIKKKPFNGIGVLYYFAGNDSGGTASARVENVAILDIYQKSVVALHPFRIGQSQAQLNWRNGTLTVVGPDSITSEHKLRSPKVVSVSKSFKRSGSKKRRVRRRASVAFGAADRR